jgi:putative FmdB family regulatory protein
MPTYEYACRDCGHRFDVWQSMSDDPLTICPECGGELRKVFAPPAITFKGSGFYATDHGKQAKPSEKAEPKKAGAAAGRSGGSGGEGSGGGGKDAGAGGSTGSNSGAGGSTGSGSNSGAGGGTTTPSKGSSA